MGMGAPPCLDLAFATLNLLFKNKWLNRGCTRSTRTVWWSCFGLGPCEIITPTHNCPERRSMHSPHRPLRVAVAKDGSV